MRESSPISPTTIKPARRSRRNSREGPSIEEMSLEDMGYDGDIEVVYPDQYEEPESDSETNASDLRLMWTDTDDELATRMRKLRWNAQTNGSPRHDENSRGRKRMSKEMEGDWHHSIKKTDIEVIDLDGHSESRSIKRRKAKDAKPIPLRRLSTDPVKAWRSDSSDRTEGRRTPITESLTSTSTSEHQLEDDREAMDVD